MTEAPNISDGSKETLVEHISCDEDILFFFLEYCISRLGRRENPIYHDNRNVDYNPRIFFCQIISGNV